MSVTGTSRGLGGMMVYPGPTGPAGSAGPTGPTGAAGYRQTPIDANTVAQWKLVDAVGAASIAETNGAYPLNTIVGPPTLYRRGPFLASMQSLSLPGYVRGAPTLEPAGNSISLDCWIFVLGGGGPWQYAFMKGYNNAWGPHYECVGLSMSGNGLTAYASLDLGAGELAVAAPSTWTLNAWHHLGMSYDGAVLRLYVDGQLSNQSNFAGAIDYGTHQDWTIGNCHLPGSQNNWTNAMIADARVSNIVRPLSYFRGIWMFGGFM